MQVKSTKKLKKNQLIFTTMEEMTDFQRFIKVNKLKQIQVAEYLGTSPQYVNQVANGKCALSDDKYELLAKSPWDTSMLTFPSYIKVPASVMSPYTPDDTAAIMSQQEVMARAMEQGHHITTDAQSIGLTEVPVEIVEEIKAEVVAEAAIPLISPEAANKPNFDVRVYIEENGGELEHINPNELLKGADAAERVLRGAMQPTFIPSDVIFVRFLQNKTKITDGNIYYFDLKSRPTMIRKVKIEGDKLRLIAENPDFGDVITDFADILNVADIVGMFRTTFSTQYSDIEAVRRKKDEQIDNLIEQNGKALHIITDLIKR